MGRNDRLSLKVFSSNGFLQHIIVGIIEMMPEKLNADNIKSTVFVPFISRNQG